MPPAMPDDRYTFIAHRALDFMNPMGENACARLLPVLDLPRGGNIADFGAGKCELPLRLIERFAVHADCVELSPLIAAEARQRAARRVKPDSIRIHEGDAGAFKATIPPGAFDLTICIGSTHALGGFPLALETLRRLTRPGALVLIGEGYWRAPPPPEYLRVSGVAADEFRPLAETVAAATDAGLVPVWCAAASEQDWDEYEWALARAIEDHVRRNRDDPGGPAMLARSRAWRGAYLAHGRACLGFALMLFRVGP